MIDFILVRGDMLEDVYDIDNDIGWDIEQMQGMFKEAVVNRNAMRLCSRVRIGEIKNVR